LPRAIFHPARISLRGKICRAGPANTSTFRKKSRAEIQQSCGKLWFTTEQRKVNERYGGASQLRKKTPPKERRGDAFASPRPGEPLLKSYAY